MSRVTKKQMIDALIAAGVEVAPTATIIQLRPMYDLLGINDAQNAQNNPSAQPNLNLDEEHDVQDANDAQNVNDAQDENDAQDANNVERNSEYGDARNSEYGDANSVVQANANIDAEYELWRKQRDLLLLKNEVYSLQRAQQVTEVTAACAAIAPAAVVAPTVTAVHRHITFSDIEYAIPDFTGNDRSHDVRDFIRGFEEIMLLSKADDSFKLLALRRKMKEAARCLIRAPEAVSYNGLRELLIEEFGGKLTMAEAERLLRQRKWKRGDETMHHYILEMQGLRRHLDIGRFTEIEFVDLVIEGLSESSENAYLLYGANTIRELKDRVNRFDHKLTNRSSSTAVPSMRMRIIGNGPAVNNRVNAAAGSRPQHTATNTSATRNNDGIAVPKCYNCSKNGHYQSACPYERRPTNSCFNCWGTGHTFRFCPNPKKILPTTRMAAAAGHADEQNDVEPIEALEAVNMVSVTFLDNLTGGTKLTNIVSLFDTGSPISFVRRSLVPHKVTESLRSTGLIGLGGTKIQTHGEVNCQIEFKQKKENLKLTVLPTESMTMSLVLGRDFLSKFKIFLSQMKFLYPKEQLLKINEAMLNKTSKQTYFCAPMSSKFAVAKRFNLIRPVAKPMIQNTSQISSFDDIFTDTEIPIKNEGKIMTSVPHIFAIDYFEDEPTLNIGKNLSISDSNQLRAIVNECYVCPIDVKVQP